MLIRLMNLPRRIQLIVAASIAAFLVMLIVSFAFAVIVELKNQSAQITELRLRAGKLSAIAALKEQTVKNAASPLHASEVEFLLDGVNLPIAKANLQSRIGAIAAAHGATVSSSGSVPDLTENGLLLIGLRADISGPNEAIESVLAEIESNKPLLLVREFMLRSEGTLPIDSPLTLTASIRLYGATRATADAPLSSNGNIEPAAVQP